MNNKNNKITSITLTEEQRKFFDEETINVSHFIRDLIDASERYKRWKESKNG